MSRVEKEPFSDEMNDSTQSSLSGDKWETLRNLADVRSIVIEGADKVSSVVVWDKKATSRKVLNNYGIPIYRRMLNLTKMFFLV